MSYLRLDSFKLKTLSNLLKVANVVGSKVHMKIGFYFPFYQQRGNPSAKPIFTIDGSNDLSLTEVGSFLGSIVQLLHITGSALARALLYEL
jgi:hypothetical protein